MINRVAEFISTTFYDIIVCQFGISALGICMSVYQLSMRANNSVELLSYALYLVCMLGQFFVYCYFGNELTVQVYSLKIIWWLILLPTVNCYFSG